MEKTTEKATEKAVIVDARGMACPKPVIEAKKALEQLKEKNVKVLVDNPIAVQNLEKLGGYMGLETKAEKLEEHEYSVWFYGKNPDISKEGIIAENPAEEPEKTEVFPEETCIPDSRKKGKVVVISSDTMGNGDNVLGRLLMKGFLYALTELDNLPETVILYNGGAKLSIEGSDSLEDLKNLEAQGTEIMTCGTCLNHYQIADKLAVGRVTNMYEIAEKMMNSSAIVKP